MKKYLKNNSLNKSLLMGLLVFLLYSLFTNLSGMVNIVAKKTTKINDYQNIGLFFGGFKKPVNILLLFENNAESNFGGGMIGSVGLIRVDSGSIKPEPIRSVYYYDYVVNHNPNFYTETDSKGRQTSYSLRSVENLDWPTNASRAAKIFTKESGQSVDGVITVTPELLRAMLKITGPVYLEDYQKTVTADNLLESVQLEVETGEDKQARRDPKTILSSVANKLLVKFSQKSLPELQSYVPQLDNLLKSHQILLYSNDDQIQQSLSRLGYDGSIVAFDADFFLMAEHNIVAEKSSSYIDRSVQRKITVHSDGKVVVDVNLKRTHTSDYQFRYTDPTSGGEAWLISRNTSDVKIALPAGSKIIAQSENTQMRQAGQEKGYDLFVFLTTVEPLQTAEYQFSYELPYRQALDSRLVINSYSQATNAGFPINQTIAVGVPDGYRLVAANKDHLTASEGQISYNTITNKDLYMSLIYEKIPK